MISKSLFRDISGFNENIQVSDNMVYDVQGNGLVLDTTSCIVQNSKLEKCLLGGISIKTDEYIKLP